MNRTELWHKPRQAARLHRWSASYDAARVALDECGGYLLPFRQLAYLYESESICALRLDPNDPDWERIDYDGVHPRDRRDW